MPILNGRTPKYRRHRASGQAIVTLGGRDHYLGPWNTKASKVEYDRLIAEWLAAGRQAALPEPGAGLTVTELCVRYCRFAERHYRKNGRPTSEVHLVKHALRHVRALYGHTEANAFGPLAMKAVREKMIAGRAASDGKAIPGMCRIVVNRHVGRIRRMFKWGVENELVAPQAWHALQAVAGLRLGKSEARESAGVEPVAEADLQATLGELREPVCDMVRLQRLTGARPGEICVMRPMDVDRAGKVWVFAPHTHKLQHHGRQRVIFLGPQAQAILTQYLLRAGDAYCFSPAEAAAKRRQERRAARKTPVQPSQRDRRQKRPRKSAGARYTTNSYCQAIHAACVRAGIDKWGPNRLRHLAATKIRAEFGLEGAQVVLGHAKADVTQVYAERDLAKASEIMGRVG